MRFRIACFVGAICLVSCDRSATEVPEKLAQRGYLWQRGWTPSVNDALAAAQQRLDGVIILGGEINWSEKEPVVAKSNIDWSAMRLRGLSCALALRVSPVRGQFDGDRSKSKFIADTARSLINAA